MFLTLIVGLSSHLTDVSSGLTDKLGMYFYISQSVDADVSNTKVVSLLKELEDAGVDATYMSKEDAANSLSKKLPAIVKSFKDYDIDAKLPATLYVTVHNEKAHKSLETILPRYADIIDNVKDVTSSSSVKTQEQRVMRALDFAYFIKGSSIVLIAIFSLVMIGVVLLLLFFKLKQFEDIISLKKML
jgi:cell division protein FtsX